MKKKICFVSTTRAEYGPLKWIMREVDSSNEFSLQLIVTGAHLMREQGYTIDKIIEDGFEITETVNVTLDSITTSTIAESMGRLAEKISFALKKIQPDYVAVLGDRYELLPIVNTAFVMNIPIIHFSGGDVTEGAIDNGIRNAVTMLSDYHFPATDDSAANIIRMRGTKDNIWIVGEPGLDAFFREQPLSRKYLADSLDLNASFDWCLFTFHAETKETIDYNLNAARNCLECLLAINNLQIIATYSNADFGGLQINEHLESVSMDYAEKIRVVPSLGTQKYLSLMREVRFVIGNSSSGIIEAPTLGVPVVNIGERQKGRHLCDNVIQTDTSKEGIEKAVEIALNQKKHMPDYYWGDGHTAERVIRIMERELA